MLNPLVTQVWMILDDDHAIVDLIRQNHVPFAVLEWEDPAEKYRPSVKILLDEEHLELLSDSGPIHYRYHQLVYDPRFS